MILYNVSINTVSLSESQLVTKGHFVNTAKDYCHIFKY